MNTLKTLIYLTALLIALPGMAAAQGCTITVSYFSGASAAAVSAFQGSPSTFGNAMAGAYFAQNALSTTATVSNIVPSGGDVNFDITYTLPSASDTATIQNPLGFPFVINVANALIGTGQDPIVFGLSVVSNTNTCLSPPPPTGVPTLSQWGLILLGLVLLSIGVIRIWRRQHDQPLVHSME